MDHGSTPDLPRKRNGQIRSRTVPDAFDDDFQSPTSGPTARHAVPNLSSFFCQPSATLEETYASGVIGSSHLPQEGSTASDNIAITVLMHAIQKKR